jgi:NitT/TauT family transport system substrate-binding protein
MVAASPVSAQLKKARFSVSAASIAEVPFRIAHVKGFYRDEGLDVEVIMIRGAVGMQALLGGSVDYTSSSGSTIAAAVRGIPVRLVFIASAKPQFDLVVQPEIRSVQDLKGKVIGISSRGGAVDLLMQLLLQKNGLVPNKDVTTIVVGAQEETVLALRAGRIAAGLFTPPRPLVLKREGFTRLAYTGDYMPTYPSGGIGATEEKIRTNPAEALADEFFQLYLSRLPADGGADETWMKGAIEFTQKSLGDAGKNIPTHRVFDFSFVSKAAPPKS